MTSTKQPASSKSVAPKSIAPKSIAPKSVSVWCLYLIRTRHNALYAGITTDVVKRFAEHSKGPKGAKYLRSKGPLTLVYQVNIGSRSLASKAEYRIKQLRKSQKEQIVVTAPPRDELLSLLMLSNSDTER